MTIGLQNAISKKKQKRGRDELLFWGKSEIMVGESGMKA